MLLLLSEQCNGRGRNAELCLACTAGTCSTRLGPGTTASRCRSLSQGNAVPSPTGHVFPEFKESDAMFAAERVSERCWRGGRRCCGTGLAVVALGLLNLQFLLASISLALETLLCASLACSLLLHGQFWVGVQRLSLKLPEGGENWPGQDISLNLLSTPQSGPTWWLSSSMVDAWYMQMLPASPFESGLAVGAPERR